MRLNNFFSGSGGAMPGGGKAGGCAAVLEILGETTAPSEPGENSFHDPFSGDVSKPNAATDHSTISVSK